MLFRARGRLRGRRRRGLGALHQLLKRGDENAAFFHLLLSDDVTANLLIYFFFLI